MIEIDGSYLEAGGQIVRTAIALSAVTGKPCRIFNIRKGRPSPGLKAQHLEGVNALTKLCSAKVKGNNLGSKEIEFYPGKIKGGKYKIDIGTAGSTTLILQTLIPAAIHADKEVELEIIGGTNVAWSPSINYFQHIFCNFMKKMGIDIFIETLKYGFYPKGGGKIIAKIKPCKELNPFNLTERGNLKKIDAWSIASKQLKDSKVAERQLDSAEKIIGRIEKKNIVYCDSLSIGSCLHLHAHFENCKLGADSLGERGKPAEKVGEECALLLKKQIDSKACLDRWMADQILPYIALAVCNITDRRNFKRSEKENISAESSCLRKNENDISERTEQELQQTQCEQKFKNDISAVNIAMHKNESNIGKRGINDITCEQKDISAPANQRFTQEPSAQKFHDDIGNTEIATRENDNIGEHINNKLQEAQGSHICRFSVAEITNHCLTNAWVIEKFLPVKFKIDKEEQIIEVKSLF